MVAWRRRGVGLSLLCGWRSMTEESFFRMNRLGGPWVEDRVKMMRATRAALSPLLVVFQDDIRHSVGGIIRAITGGPPLEVATMAGGYSLRLWQLKDPGTLEVLRGLMRDSAIFIADGHHRYEAAMRYRSAIRAEREIESEEAVNYRMMHIVSIDEPGTDHAWVSPR